MVRLATDSNWVGYSLGQWPGLVMISVSGLDWLWSESAGLNWGSELGYSLYQELGLVKVYVRNLY